LEHRVALHMRDFMGKLLVIFCLVSVSAFAQFGSSVARRVTSGTAAPPAACSASPVDIYARTGATLPGFYLCLTTNTWTGPLGGGGSGTVSPNNGSAGAVANYAAAGGSTTVGPTTMTYGATGPLAVANQGTTCIPAYTFTGMTGSGMANFNGSSLVALCTATNSWLELNSSNITIIDGGVFTWSASFGAGPDTGISREANSILDFGNGSGSDTTGKLKAAAYMSVGTKFTSNAGCTEGTLVGGATAGKFTVGQSTACTIIITMGNSATAPNGWTCVAYDQTAVPAVAIRQTASTTTTCSLLMTVATNDVITFSAMGY
jgi:hypothetical protein